MADDNKTQEREEIQPVFGVHADAEFAVDNLIVDTSELTEGGLSDLLGTIIGFDRVQGGEQRERKNEPGTYFTTRDQLRMHIRIDNADELDIEKPYTVQFFSLPKESIGPDGRKRIARPTSQSNYGIWLAVLEGLGVSSAAEAATVYHFSGLRDLIGLKIHRVIQEFPSYSGNTNRVPVITEVFGFDNDFRKEQGLKPAHLIGEEPAKATAKAS